MGQDTIGPGVRQTVFGFALGNVCMDTSVTSQFHSLDECLSVKSFCDLQQKYYGIQLTATCPIVTFNCSTSVQKRIGLYLRNAPALYTHSLEYAVTSHFGNRKREIKIYLLRKRGQCSRGNWFTFQTLILSLLSKLIFH